MMLTAAVFVSALVALVTPLPTSNKENIDLLMPKVKPKTPDTYLCTAIEVKDRNRYITGFVPNADAQIAHHILLYGCETPGQMPGHVWNCGEMTSKNSDFDQEPVCLEGPRILYAWAMEAPRLQLPPGVGFHVGQDTDIKYLVVQVHYKNVTKFLPPVNGDDSSGLTLETTLTSTEKRAGVYLLGTSGYIPAHSIEYFETACTFDEDTEIVPFAYRTHAHSLGRVISGYRVRDGRWEEIGRQDPRLPEMFYNVTTPNLVVKKGDVLAARCTMENTLDHDVGIGPTQNDEMCNFYVMYYVKSPPTPKTNQCFQAGPPYLYFNNFTDTKGLNPSAVPHSASLNPATGKLYVRNATYPKMDDARSEAAVPVGEEGGQGHAGDDSSINYLLNEAVNEMDPTELEFLVEQLAEEEAAQERMNLLWEQRQYERWLARQQQEQQQQQQQRRFAQPELVYRY